jgi:hypothetical protein
MSCHWQQTTVKSIAGRAVTSWNAIPQMSEWEILICFNVLVSRGVSYLNVFIAFASGDFNGIPSGHPLFHCSLSSEALAYLLLAIRNIFGDEQETPWDKCPLYSARMSVSWFWFPLYAKIEFSNFVMCNDPRQYLIRTCPQECTRHNMFLWYEIFARKLLENLASQEIACFHSTWIYITVLLRLPLDLIFSQLNPVHSSTLYVTEIHFNNIFLQYVWKLEVFWFPQSLYALLFPTERAESLTYLSIHHLITVTILGE